MAHESHHFDWNANRCMGCDCRPFGIWAGEPCGSDTPTPGAPSYVEIVVAAREAGVAL